MADESEGSHFLGYYVEEAGCEGCRPLNERIKNEHRALDGLLALLDIVLVNRTKPEHPEGAQQYALVTDEDVAAVGAEAVFANYAKAVQERFAYQTDCPGSTTTETGVVLCGRDNRATFEIPDL